MSESRCTHLLILFHAFANSIILNNLRFPVISVSNSRLAHMANLALMDPLQVHQVPLDHTETVAADQVVLPQEVPHVSVQYALHVLSVEHVR